MKGAAMTRTLTAVMSAVLALAFAAPAADAASAEVEELKQQVRILQQRLEQMEQREKERAAEARPAAAAPGAAAVTTAAEPPLTGATGEVKSRGTLRNEQEAAPRPDDLLLDPQFRGFTRIPNTKVIIKFNAKPRTDITLDTENAGDDNRFVTAKIPVHGHVDHGGDPRFNINAKGSELRIDVRAPEIAGKPRFY
jgi:hypothetical protein